MYPYNSILSSFIENEEALYELIGKDLQDALKKQMQKVYIVMQSFGNYRNIGRISMKLMKVNNCGWGEDGSSINASVETSMYTFLCFDVLNY